MQERQQTKRKLCKSGELVGRHQADPRFVYSAVPRLCSGGKSPTCRVRRRRWGSWRVAWCSCARAPVSMDDHDSFPVGVISRRTRFGLELFIFEPCSGVGLKSPKPQELLRAVILRAPRKEAQSKGVNAPDEQFAVDDSTALFWAGCQGANCT